MPYHIGVAFLFLFFTFGLSFFTKFFINAIFPQLQESSFSSIEQIIQLGLFLVSYVLQIGILRIYMETVDGQTPEVSVLFKSAGKYRQFFILSLLSGVLITLGYVVFIIPGIILSLFWYFSSYVVLDEDVGVVEAMKQSKELTEGVRVKILLFEITTMFVNTIGMAFLGVGGLVSFPITSLARVHIYRSLHSQTLGLKTV